MRLSRQTHGGIQRRNSLITFQKNASRVEGEVTQSGGLVRDGEAFTIEYAPGGLTGTLGCTLDGQACTGYSVTDDTNAGATAPVGLGAGTYVLVIS